MPIHLLNRWQERKLFILQLSGKVLFNVLLRKIHAVWRFWNIVTAAFPEYKSVLSNQKEEIMTKEQKKKKRIFNESINLGSRKVDKVFLSEIV